MAWSKVQNEWSKSHLLEWWSV